MMAARNVSTPQTSKANGVLRMIANRSTLNSECKSGNFYDERSKSTKDDFKDRELTGYSDLPPPPW